MKRLSYLCMLLLGLAFVSCGGDGDDPILPDPPAIITSTTLEKTLADNAAAEVTVNFKAPMDWRVKSEADWITPARTQGTASDNVSLTLKVAENTSTEDREGVVNVETIEKSQQFVKITIRQKGREVVNNPDENQNAPAGMKKNAAALVREIKVGWNLGNTCESGIWDGYNQDVDLEGETAWGNPKTTKAMITALHDAGFNAIRIPCRWYLHSDDDHAHADGDIIIRAAWMNRVKEIVDYAVTQDMYVILNSHHDNWYDRLPVGYNTAKIHNRFTSMWTQIATAFKDYDEHLIFAGANEIIKLNADGSENWGEPNTDDVSFATGLMQKFVDAVRATGGNNEWRCLMVQPWAAAPANSWHKLYRLPEDKHPNRLIQEFHCYDPYHYAIGKDQKGNQWAKHEPSQAELSAVAEVFAGMKRWFIDKGTPVIMAEFGSTQDNSHPKGEAEADQIRYDYHKFIVSEAKKNGIPGFYWDNGAFTGDGENFGLLDRKSCTFPARAQKALQGIMDGLK